MTVTILHEFDFNDIKNNVWSGATFTIELLEFLELEQEFIDLLNDLQNEWTLTQVNDLLWFEDDYILESLGYDLEQVIADYEVNRGK